MGFKIPSIEDMIRSANNDLIKLECEIKLIESTDADKLFLSNKYKDMIQFSSIPTKEDLEYGKEFLLRSKRSDMNILKEVLSNQTTGLRDQKLNDIGI